MRRRVEEGSMIDVQNAPAGPEDDSRHFIDYGAWFVPERETQIDTICSVIPPAPDGAVIVDVCCGEGLLCTALARRFPAAEIHALDGSQTMLASAKSRLEATGVEHRTTIIDIADTTWRNFDTPVHAFVSSLPFITSTDRQRLDCSGIWLRRWLPAVWSWSAIWSKPSATPAASCGGGTGTTGCASGPSRRR